MAQTPQVHTLYRFFGAGGTLLYIGITNSIPARLRQHNNGKDWWFGVSNMTVEHYPSREAVLEAERRAIIAEKPLYNDTHNAEGKIWRSAAVVEASPEIVAVCQGCGNSITEDWEDGTLHIEQYRITQILQEWRDWHAASSDNGFCDLTEIAAMPSIGRWQVHCGDCNPHRDPDDDTLCDSCYAINTSQIRTWQQLAKWTAHLADKAWLAKTDWFDMLGSLANGTSDSRFVTLDDYVAVS